MMSRVMLVVATLALVVAAGCNAAEKTTPKVSIDVKKLPAFPGAEGFGAVAVGGRGGKVFEVTNLEDSGPGSLREAVDANEPRIVVFRVAGNIELKRAIRINRPFITIAGQTAPGDGICLKNFPLDIRASNVVIRFIRVRPGDVARQEMDGIWGTRSDRVILDHVSSSWSIDETISFTRGGPSLTVQYCISSESLYKSVHSKGNHGYGGIFAADNGTYHHNLLASHTSRNPRFAKSITTDYRNNVTYNWGFNSAYGGDEGSFNIINNYYKAGPATRQGVRNRMFAPDTRPNSDLTGKWYVTGNYVDGFPDVTADNWKGGVQPRRLALDLYRSDKEFAAPAIKMQSAKDAYETVLRTAGCVLPKRDALDARIIEEVRTGTAKYGKSFDGGGNGIIDSQEDVGGWPELKGGTPPADSDHDGMPDEWEKKYGLNPRDPSDGAKDADGDGYTNVEECLNGTEPTKFVDYTRPENNIDVLVK
jgi:pectate lyase